MRCDALLGCMLVGLSSRAASPSALLVASRRRPVTYTMYMGRDKIENEDLIRFGWPVDLWFHVDNLSSAHVYLRLPAGMTPKQIPTSVLADCAQLVKANSIIGNKKETGSVRIVYTPWQNLYKTRGMADGQVSFKDNKQCMYTTVLSRENAIVNRLDKTKVEKPTAFIRGESMGALECDCAGGALR
jgi:hypothetical protein